ncbi:hypothetical protein [Psychroserpens sp. SPM9]|uniref:hypothetical protein n=1 Tax=Psychroserpens sp. SPM9 TaxID=2975598 RepID=UPI0021A79BB5|nr:hypothetical protein [Psychroserpens sp. SPM9]MDG5490401.1 hypothetical protein [Psychroserpens sp. SPM9]
MKQASTLFMVLLGINLYAQDDIKTNGIFYKISLATTLTVNEDFTLGDDTIERFFRTSAFFLNNTVGFQFDDRSALGLNAEYNWHSESGLQFLPVHLSFQYNIVDFDDTLFIRVSYGRLVGINSDFEKGTLYKVGLGARLFDENFKNSWLIGIDFTRKRFGFRQLEKLSSLSFFLEFMLF